MAKRRMGELGVGVGDAGTGEIEWFGVFGDGIAWVERCGSVTHAPAPGAGGRDRGDMG